MTNPISSVTQRKLPSDLDNIHSQPPMIQRFELATMPSDIILEIFSYLKQEDCLICMAVCRDWFQNVPDYTQDAWTTIQLNVRDIHLQNTRQIRCLGEHVKTVVLDTIGDDKDIFYLMHKLFEWKCTKIENLEFKDCVSDDQDAFVDALSKLASHLTHLTLTSHQSNIAFLHVFDACPKLSHFTYSAAAGTEWEYVKDEPNIKRKLLGTKQCTHLVYLCLDVALDLHLRLEPILKTCPDLRCFIGASCDPGRYPDDVYENLHADTLIDPGIILHWCPKITHLQNNHSYISTLNKFQYIDNKQEGLRYLNLYDIFDLDETGPLLLNFLRSHQNTLEYICIQESDPSDNSRHLWSEIFKPLHLPQLRVLYCGGSVYLEESILLPLIKDCPLLEKLAWLGVNHTVEYEPLLQSFPVLSCLHTMELQHRTIDVPLMTFLSYFPALEDLSITYSWISLTLEKTGHGLNQLKRLQLRSNGLMMDRYNDTNPENPATFLRHLAAHTSKLETIQLISEPGDNHEETFVDIECLKVVAEVPTLKNCEIGLADTSLSVEDEQNMLKLFIILLKKNTKIQQLKLGNLRQLNYDILDELKELRHLTKFDTVPPLASSDNPSYTYLDGSSLSQLLRKTISLVDISLRTITMNLAETEFGKVLEQIEEELPGYRISWYPSGVQDGYNNGDKYLCDIVVKRLQ